MRQLCAVALTVLVACEPVVIGSPAEECNGRDDNDNGRIDESWPDVDGDGVADCIDEACDVSLPAPGTITRDPNCFAPNQTVEDPWNVVIEATWEEKQVLSAPVVGLLVDLNGDGWVDSEDPPTIVVGTFDDIDSPYGPLMGFDADLNPVWRSHEMTLAFASNAIADVDGDGQNEVVGVLYSGQVAAFGADGMVEWVSEALNYNSYPVVTVADIDGDGAPEVLADGLVLSGLDGALRWRAELPNEMIGHAPVAANLDLMGSSEVIIGSTVYNAEGDRLWDTPISGNYGHWSAVLNADSDIEAEVLFVGGGTIAVYQHDGEVMWSQDSAGDQPGPPCLGDFDGDSVAEIGWASKDRFFMSELDGTVVWEREIADLSGLAGCAGWDVDRDGALEVIFHDENVFRIVDGATGVDRFSWDDHASGTVFEYPVVADVDQDGSAEIIVPSANYRTEGRAGLTIFGHANSEWPAGVGSWPVHDARGVIGEFGHVPPDPFPSWLGDNLFRGQPSAAALAWDLVVQDIEVCVASCDPDMGTFDVAIRLANLGSNPSPHSVPLTFYGLNGEDWVSTMHGIFTGSIEGGESREITYHLPIAALGPDGVGVSVNDSNRGFRLPNECDRSNNAGSWVGAVCEDGGY